MVLVAKTLPTIHKSKEKMFTWSTTLVISVILFFWILYLSLVSALTELLNEIDFENDGPL